MFALVFPGQGSQFIGMGRELHDAFPVARDVFNKVNDTLSQDLKSLMFEGSPEELTLTSNAQPALMTVSLALMAVLEKEGGIDLKNESLFKCAAGHSLGEYSALAATGALTLGDTARLLRIRGDAMQNAVPKGLGAMAAILGVGVEEAQKIAEAASQGEVCSVANDNANGQVVLSGHLNAILRAIELAPQFGAKKGIQLPVSAPFHCALMAPAQETMREALEGVVFSAPSVNIISNVTATPSKDPGVLKGQLVEQVTGQVRWRESMESLGGHGITHMVEIGAGKVLGGLMKRINPEIESLSLQTPQDIEGFLELLGRG